MKEISGQTASNAAFHTHDAQKTLADLRDHLARHDKPIAFLFGAGTSCAVQVAPPNGGGKLQPFIPTVLKLTELAQLDANALGDSIAKGWGLVEANCKAIQPNANVENILSRLRMMLNAVGETDTLCGLKKSEILSLEEGVRKTIARVVNPELSRLPNEFPHRKLARWLVKISRQCPVEIFTVNYDVLIEHALEIERIPVFDGFVGCFQPFFHPDSLRRLETAPGANWTRLWKMHGSVTWKRIEQEGRARVIRGEPDPAGEMIYPSFQKYDESRQQPYAAFTDRLSRFLEQDNALLIVAGFSFGDEHINDLVFGALDNRPLTHVYALQFEELDEDSELVKRALNQPNLIVVGPRTGIINRRRAPWAPVEIPPFMGSAFELQPNAEADSGAIAEPGVGIMNIGDFALFCDFLELMTVG